MLQLGADVLVGIHLLRGNDHRWGGVGAGAGGGDRLFRRGHALLFGGSLVASQFGLGLQHGRLRLGNLIGQSLAGVFQGGDARLVLEIGELLLRVVQLVVQIRPLGGQRVIVLPAGRMNLPMPLEIVRDDFLQDRLNDLRVRVFERDRDDTAALGGRFRLQISMNRERGRDDIIAAAPPSG